MTSSEHSTTETDGVPGFHCSLNKKVDIITLLFAFYFPVKIMKKKKIIIVMNF